MNTLTTSINTAVAMQCFVLPHSDKLIFMTLLCCLSVCLCGTLKRRNTCDGYG